MGILYTIEQKQPIYLRKYRLLQIYATCRYIMLAMGAIKQNKPSTCENVNKVQNSR